jgi:tetratricopeptide (TPR) repeat protein
MKIFKDDTIEEAYDLLLEGDLKESAELFEKELAKHPDSIHLLMELANIYYILGIMARSIIYYERALKLKPESPYMLYRMGVALYRSTHFTRASVVFRKIIDSGKYLPMTYLWLGLSYYHLGKEEKITYRIAKHVRGYNGHHT